MSERQSESLATKEEIKALALEEDWIGQKMKLIYNRSSQAGISKDQDTIIKIPAGLSAKRGLRLNDYIGELDGLDRGVFTLDCYYPNYLRKLQWLFMRGRGEINPEVLQYHRLINATGIKSDHKLNIVFLHTDEKSRQQAEKLVAEASVPLRYKTLFRSTYLVDFEGNGKKLVFLPDEIEDSRTRHCRDNTGGFIMEDITYRDILLVRKTLTIAQKTTDRYLHIS